MTLTIDDGVAVAIERLRKSRDASLKDLINEALRRGLRDMTQRPQARKPFRTRSVNLGPSKVGSLDKISEVLALVDGDDYK